MENLNLKTSLLILVLVALYFTACASSRESSAIDETIQKFHDRFNSGEYAEIYRDSDEILQTSVDEETFVHDLKALHERFGDIKNTRRITGAKSEYDYFREIMETPISKGVEAICLSEATKAGAFFEHFHFFIDENKKITLVKYDGGQIAKNDSGINLK